MVAVAAHGLCAQIIAKKLVADSASLRHRHAGRKLIRWQKLEIGHREFPDGLKFAS